MLFSPWKPPADIYYSGNQWLINLELAGVMPDEVKIIVQGRKLTVHGRRRDFRVRQGFACYSMEISYSHFERSFSLPAAIEPGSIHSEYQHGILQIHFHTVQGRAEGR